MSFSFPVRVYWEDTDAGGIVFYANYLKFMERARTEWLRLLGIEQQRLRETSGGMFVVAETQLKYLRPARLDDQLQVTAALHQAGSASLTIAQQVFATATPADVHNAVPATHLLCEGSIRIGWVDSATLRPSRIPASISETLVRSGTPRVAEPQLDKP